MRSWNNDYTWESGNHTNFPAPTVDSVYLVVRKGERFRIGMNKFECVGIHYRGGFIVSYGILNHTTMVAKWVGSDAISKAFEERDVVWLSSVR